MIRPLSWGAGDLVACLFPGNTPRQFCLHCRCLSLQTHSRTLPEKQQYPIPDRYHAELALRDLHHASQKDQVRIRQAVRKKFPGLI